MKLVQIFALAVMAALIGSGVRAVTLPETMARLMATMPGTYDTADQIKAEAAAGVAEAARHERRYVIYARIESPQIGANVLFRQERKGGPEGEIVARDLAVFEPDPAANGVRMWLRKMIDATRFADLHLKKELWNQVAIEPTYGGKCPFHWRVENNALVGTLLGGGCKITSNAGNAMSFDARWVLSAQSLSIFDNTYDGEGKLLSGRADKVPLLYTKIVQ